MDFIDIWYICHLDQDLLWDRIWVSYLIKHAHNGWSCHFRIFGIPEVNFSVRAFKLRMLRDLKGTYDVSFMFCQIPICVFLRISQLTWLRTHDWSHDNNSISFFIEFKKFLVYVPFASRSFMGLNTLTHHDITNYKSCFLVDFNGVCRGYIQNVGVLDNSSC